MRTCSIEACDKKHEAKGYCKTHYRSYLKYGNPLQVDENNANREQRKLQQSKEPRISKRSSTKGVCSIDGCNSSIKARRLCEKHYARQRRHGADEVIVKKYDVDTCVVFDCNKPHKSFGYCDYHSFLYRTNGTPFKPKVLKLCGVDGCYKEHIAKGLCTVHYREWKKLLRETEKLD